MDCPGGEQDNREYVRRNEVQRLLSRGDVVEISSLNRNDALVTEQSSLRAAKVAAIKKEVIAGTYETPWRIRGTVERLLDVIA